MNNFIPSGHRDRLPHSKTNEKTLVQLDLHSHRYLPTQTITPDDPLEVILKRQGPAEAGGIGGEDLSKVSKSHDRYDYPFMAERVEFMQDFYNYVCQAKPGGFKVTWSDWVIQNATQA